jgi:hypothetical protein
MTGAEGRKVRVAIVVMHPRGIGARCYMIESVGEVGAEQKAQARVCGMVNVPGSGEWTRLPECNLEPEPGRSLRGPAWMSGRVDEWTTCGLPAASTIASPVSYSLLGAYQSRRSSLPLMSLHACTTLRLPSRARKPSRPLPLQAHARTVTCRALKYESQVLHTCIVSYNHNCYLSRNNGPLIRDRLTGTSVWGHLLLLSIIPRYSQQRNISFPYLSTNIS